MVSGYQWSIVLGVGVLRPDIPLNPPSLSNDLLTSHTQTPPTTGDTERAPHHFDSIRILLKKKRNILCLKKCFIFHKHFILSLSELTKIKA